MERQKTVLSARYVANLGRPYKIHNFSNVNENWQAQKAHIPLSCSLIYEAGRPSNAPGQTQRSVIVSSTSMN